MQEKYIKRTINEAEEFTEEMMENMYHIYAVTLTYRIRKYNKEKGEYNYIKLPNQKSAINKDMKIFRDGIRKAFKRKGIEFECFFIYAKPDNENPHFHGLAAISEKKKLDAYLHRYWQKGFNYVKKNYDPFKESQEIDIFGWIGYLEKNIRESIKNYKPHYQIKSRTRKKLM